MSELPHDPTLNIHRYVPGRASGATPVRVELASNESPFGASPRAARAARQALARLHRYPLEDAGMLRARLAARFGLAADEVLVTNGSTEAIQLIVDAVAALHPDAEVLLPAHTFVAYERAAAVRGLAVRKVAHRADLGVDLDALAAAVSPRTRLLFLANPNNPTGGCVAGAALRRFVEMLPAHVLVVLDEAYREYVGAADGGDGLALRSACQRLVVLRTFSKAHGLAALRIGWLAAAPEWVARLDRLRVPFDTNGPGQYAAAAALDDAAHLRRVVARTIRARHALVAGLSSLGYAPAASASNFVLVPLGRPAAPVIEALLARGIAVRSAAPSGLPDAIRVSVGRRADVDAFLAAFAAVTCRSRVGECRPRPVAGRSPESRLRAIAAELQHGDRRSAVARLDELHDACVDPSGSPAQRLATFFARALRARAEGHASDPGNLYGGDAGPEAMLAAFRLLVEGTPLVRFGHFAANAAIDERTAGAAAVHVVDVGMGHGMQWLDLVRRLGARAKRPFLRLTGNDLAAPGKDPAAALRAAGERIGAAAAAAGVPYSFEPLVGPVERTLEVCRRRGELLVVNAALALHHVPDGDGVTDPAASRGALLSRLHGLAPDLLTLIEPDAAHNALPFERRVREAWRHYGLVFAVLEHLFPRALAERRTLEAAFFGREVLNVVGMEGQGRVERHDRIASWSRRLRGCGFGPVPMARTAARAAAELALAEPFSVRRCNGAAALAFRGRSLLGVSAWAAAG